MKLIIEISEKDYNNIEPFLNGKTIKGGFNLFNVLEIIRNGIPIPKGHSLIDADKEYESLKNMNTSELDDESRYAIRYAMILLENANRVVEADKE